MNKRDLWIYRIVTGLFSALMVFDATMYIFMHDFAADAFTKIGYPTYIIYPLAIAKLLGVIAIWTRKSETLKEWAYAGFFFVMLLASSAHFNVGDGMFPVPLVAMVMVLVSYNYGRKLYN